MQTVKIKSAVRYNTVISGEFPLVAGYKDDPASKRTGYIWVSGDFTGQGTKKTRLAINSGDFQIKGSSGKRGSKTAKYVPVPDLVELTDQEISNEIRDRFEVMELLTDGVIERSIKALIVSGAAGIGKTYTIDKMLLDAERSGKISKFSLMGGSCSGIGLYYQLYQHQNAGDVLVLDDMDSIFGDEEALNVLKKALDTGRQRVVTWSKASKFLEQEGMERQFEFNGTVIFITNYNFDDMIAKGNKMSVHYEALVSRCMYLDLGIHTMREVLIRMRQVIAKSNMMQKLGMSAVQTETMMEWMMDNLSELRKVDLRTLIKLSQAMKASRHGWKKIAKAALCKR